MECLALYTLKGEMECHKSQESREVEPNPECKGQICHYIIKNQEQEIKAHSST